MSEAQNRPRGGDRLRALREKRRGGVGSVTKAAASLARDIPALSWEEELIKEKYDDILQRERQFGFDSVPDGLWESLRECVKDHAEAYRTLTEKYPEYEEIQKRF